jgi:hypothetical protein
MDDLLAEFEKDIISGQRLTVEGDSRQDSEDHSPRGHKSAVKIFHPEGPRVFPLAKTIAYKEQTPNEWVNPWLTVSEVVKRPLGAKKTQWAPGSVTCIVKKAINDGGIYMLTVGHAFYDMDPCRFLSWVDDAEAHRDSNTLDYYWGEGDKSLSEYEGFKPFAKSVGQYFRMGDKLKSQVDCGLALIENDVRWSNNCVLFSKKVIDIDTTGEKNEIWKEGKNLFKLKVPVGDIRQAMLVNFVALDNQWPPTAEFYYCREQKIARTAFKFVDLWHCEFQNWQLKFDSSLKCVMLRPRPKGSDSGPEKSSCKQSSCP